MLEGLPSAQKVTFSHFKNRAQDAHSGMFCTTKQSDFSAETVFLVAWCLNIYIKKMTNRAKRLFAGGCIKGRYMLECRKRNKCARVENHKSDQTVPYWATNYGIYTPMTCFIGWCLLKKKMKLLRICNKAFLIESPSMVLQLMFTNPKRYANAFNCVCLYLY